MDATTEADVTTLDLSHNCDSCGLQFTKQRCRSVGLHMARWCDGDRTQRTFTTLHADRQSCENGQATSGPGGSGQGVCRQRATGQRVSQLQGNGEDEADVRHRMDVAQSAFGSPRHLWSDHRMSRATNSRLFHLSVCSKLTHSCEAWLLTRTVVRVINSRCLHAITREDFRATATVPADDLVLAVRKSSGIRTAPYSTTSAYRTQMTFSRTAECVQQCTTRQLDRRMHTTGTHATEARQQHALIQLRNVRNWQTASN